MCGVWEITSYSVGLGLGIYVYNLLCIVNYLFITIYLFIKIIYAPAQESHNPFRGLTHPLTPIITMRRGERRRRRRNRGRKL